MYKQKIKSWGLDKKHKEHEVLEIIRLQAQRHAEGKRSTFVLRGRVVNMHSLHRYLQRKKRSLHEGSTQPLQERGTRFEAIDLVCRTPSPDPWIADPGRSLDEMESFYVVFSQYLNVSVETGVWAPARGSTSLYSSLSVCGEWTDVLETINLGVARFNQGGYEQAMWHWRTAFIRLELVVSSRNYYQLLNLISAIGQLAACTGTIARIMLQHLANLVSVMPSWENPQYLVLKKLSELEPAIFEHLLLFTRRCCLPIFDTSFSDHQPFVLFWEAALAQTESRDGIWTFSPLLLARMVACVSSNGEDVVMCLTAAERLISALEQSMNLEEATYLSGLCIERLRSSVPSAYLAGQLFRAYVYLARIKRRLGKPHEILETLLLAVDAYEELTCWERNEDQRHDWFMMYVLDNLIALESTMGLSIEVEVHITQRSTLVATLDKRVLEQLRNEDLDEY